jgi:hypothetical protein
MLFSREAMWSLRTRTTDEDAAAAADTAAADTAADADAAADGDDGAAFCGDAALRAISSASASADTTLSLYLELLPAGATLGLRWNWCSSCDGLKEDGIATAEEGGGDGGSRRCSLLLAPLVSPNEAKSRFKRSAAEDEGADSCCWEDGGAFMFKETKC